MQILTVSETLDVDKFTRPRFICLRAIVVMYPHAVHWLEQNSKFSQEIIDATRHRVLDASALEDERRELNALKVDCQKAFMLQWSQRIVDIAILFSNLPVLIVAEICLFEQPYLRDVPQYMYWRLIENVYKSIVKRKISCTVD